MQTTSELQVDHFSGGDFFRITLPAADRIIFINQIFFRPAPLIKKNPLIQPGGFITAHGNKIRLHRFKPEWHSRRPFQTVSRTTDHLRKHFTIPQPGPQQ
ncbi:hypothetical protein BvCmsNSP047_05261 [Escherichia coli]|nr:hypothetical protein BvCmsNSP047_05261 [Escherichia coli]